MLEDQGHSVSLLNYGAITRSWRVPLAGRRVGVVLGYGEARRYLADRAHMGAIAGRLANRTARGYLALAGRGWQLSRNEGAHHLHGGTRGLGRRFWRLERDGARAARLTYLSPDGEEGYPGAVRFRVDVSLRGGRLRYDMRATPDRPTPINLAQHNYYNLMGVPGGTGPGTEPGTVLGHSLRIAADRFTPVDGEMIPTGAVQPVPGGLDFRAARALGPEDGALDVNLVAEPGYGARRDPARPLAELRAPNGLQLCLYSDQPGLQLYTGAHLGAATGGKFPAFSGVCLEPQQFPDAVNQPGFPPVIATPDHPYRQQLSLEITHEEAP